MNRRSLPRGKRSTSAIPSIFLPADAPPLAPRDIPVGPDSPPAEAVTFCPPSECGRGSLACPRCGCRRHRTLETRTSHPGAIRRRRQCTYCSGRFTTLETVSLVHDC